ncbi:MAG: hypothetical protein Q4A04_03555 [Eubacteriales bacterium]|nr:hypothetical protein [Eubacteriales bacterium]
MLKKEIMTIDSEIRKGAVQKMTENLAALRTMCHYSQADLACLLGMSRQSLISLEKGKRLMTWPVYLSLVFIFRQYEDTSKLMKLMGIFPEDLKEFYGDLR